MNGSLDCFLVVLLSTVYVSQCYVTQTYIVHVTEVTILNRTVKADDNFRGCSLESYNRSCCEHDEYRCSEGKCIHLSKVCDSGLWELTSAIATSKLVNDRMDCLGGYDEVGCLNKPCALRNPQCPHSCLDLSVNKSQCRCYQGFKQLVYFNTSSQTAIEKCEDIDECVTGFHKCRHGCENLNGTYKCTCRDGFTIDPFDHYGTCKALDKDIFILYNSGSWIHSYSVKEKKVKQIVPSGRLCNMDYDIHTNIIYWWNKHSHRMQRSYIPGAKDNQVTIGFPQTLDTNILMDNVQRFSLAVDWMGGNLYWISRNALNKTLYDIMASTLDGRYMKSIISVVHAFSLVLDAENGVMYWISKEKSYVIYSAWMNGERNQIVLNFDHGMHPTIMALDYSSSTTRLFWWDSKSNYIFSGFTDGTSVRRIVSIDSALKPSSMEIFDEYIYWITNHSHQLVKQDKYGKGEIITLVKNLQHESSLQIYHKNKIDKSLIHRFRKQCKESCSHFCFNTPAGLVCSCPDGYTQNKNEEETCDTEKVDGFPDPLICNCSNKKEICNSSSPYSLCHCKAPCQRDYDQTYWYADKQNNNRPHKKLTNTLLEIVFGIIFTAAVLACFILSFYKRQASALI